jgi:hypothetical protein
LPFVRSWRRSWLVAAPCVLALAVACGGSGTTPCDDYYRAFFTAACPGNLVPPPAEVAREQRRFDTLCNATLALPGVGLMRRAA